MRPGCSTTKRRPLPSPAWVTKTGASNPFATVRSAMAADPGTPVGEAGEDDPDGAALGDAEAVGDEDGPAVAVGGGPVGVVARQALTANAHVATRAAIRTEPAVRWVRCIR
jgi:hypothetical protein